MPVTPVRTELHVIQPLPPEGSSVTVARDMMEVSVRVSVCSFSGVRYKCCLGVQ